MLLCLCHLFYNLEFWTVKYSIEPRKTFGGLLVIKDDLVRVKLCMIPMEGKNPTHVIEHLLNFEN